MKITAYKTLSHNSANNLDTLVNEAITNGWQPYGNQYIAVGFGFDYCQAMVRYKGEA
jgi:hypothetical protein